MCKSAFIVGKIRSLIIVSKYNINIPLLKEQVYQSWLAYETSNYEFWKGHYQMYDFQVFISHRDAIFSNKAIRVVVEELMINRMLVNSSIPADKLATINASTPSGRILIYNPYWTFYDCIAQFENDFFNDADIPSWQSWLQYTYVEGKFELGCLIAWVPNEILKDVGFDSSDLINGFFWADDLQNTIDCEDKSLYKLCVEINKHF